MFQLLRYILHQASILLLFLPFSLSVLASDTNTPEKQTDSIYADAPQKRQGLISKIINYFDSSNKRRLTSRPDFSILGGPHYSSEKGLGLGIVVAGAYITDTLDEKLPASNISLVGDIATKSFYMIGIRGAHIFPTNSKRINYSISFESFDTYFWGIGYEEANDNSNKTKYQQLKFDITADMEWQLVKGLYVGPANRFLHVNAENIADVSRWGLYSHAISAMAVGGKLQFDLRDNFTAPKRGLLLELTQLFYPRFLFNSDHSFSSTEFSASKYISTWKNAILAMRLHALFTYGKTPWCAMAYIGGTNMRGYYEGRYRDKNEMDFTVEIRQHLYRRSGVVAWLGVASVFPKFSKIGIKKLQPECGIGYRWEFKKNSNVRIDFGIGKHSTGFMFGLNEAF